MINAKDARRKALLVVVGKQAMDLIEKSILYAIAFGKLSTSLDAEGLERDVLEDIVIPELQELGYKVEFIPKKPLPCGWPSDQWDSTDTLNISWKEEHDDKNIL